MKIFYTLRCASFIFLAVLSLQACRSQSSNEVDSNQPSKTDSDKKNELVWLTNLNDAQAQSVKEQKPILVSFTSSDTCGLCKQFQTNVLATPAFKSWAENRLVLLEVDFSAHNSLPEGTKEQNAAMAKSLKVTTFPACWILRMTHEPENNRFKVKPIGTVAYQETPEKFIGMLANLTRQ